MRKITLGDLQESLADKSGFTQLADYAKFGSAFLALLEAEKPTRIVSPSPANRHYVFYQYGKASRNKITRPLNTQLYFESRDELSAAFDRFKAIIASETKHIHAAEVVGSVKTTSKDRIDKVFLDKFLLTKLLGRDIPVIAIFLHDVQRAKRGESIFGINSTFKTNHFLGYTVALNKLDGVYYVDPRPDMLTNTLLREQIRDFQSFLVRDLWSLAKE
jgi:hypothetical protein